MSDTWKLLIVDDCAEDRKIYRRSLLKDPHVSYQIWEADSAEDGLALCQKIHCDIILLDLRLPCKNGLEFLDELELLELKTPRIVIVLTGHGEQEVAVQAMKRGIQDYLVKQHLKPDVLQLAVRNAIAKLCLEAQLSKTQERQRLIATTALRIRSSLNLEQILKTAVVEVQQLLKCDRVVVYQYDSDKSGKIVAEVASPACDLIPGNIQAICWQPGACENICQGKKTAIANVDEAGLSLRGNAAGAISGRFLSHCCLDSLKPFSTRGNLVIPITLNNNGSTPKIWGWLVAHQCSQERQWQADEIAMLDEVSVQLAIAIQQAELLAMTQTALEKEKQLNAFKSQIVATVSHEYHTPLAAILAAASTIKQHGNNLEPSKQQRLLQIIEEKARHMTKLVDDLLVVNQSELNKTRFKPLPLALVQLVTDLIEEQSLIAGARQELDFKVTGNTKNFWGNRRLLRLILENLLSNAINYSLNRGKVKIRLIGKDSHVIFSVKDEGIGIPVKDRENLFQPFSRGSNVGTIPGTGLGLAIVKDCVELHGGQVALVSQVGKGTKVTVSLPKRSPQEQICPSHS